MIEFKEETFDECYLDTIPLLKEHWKEVAVYQDDVPLDVDVDRYRQLEEMDRLHIVTCRDDGKLVGYCVTFINNHLHYKSTVFALNDIIYLSPEYRRAGVAYEMVTFVEECLKARWDVKVLTLHMKTAIPFESLAEACGFNKVEYIYSKVV
jgi:GNAT superfamily N-acetyltransferase